MTAIINPFALGNSGTLFKVKPYTGTAAARDITTGQNLNEDGGLVLLKKTSAAGSHYLFDTERGATKYFNSDNVAAETTAANTLTAFNVNGFALGSDTLTNTSSAGYISLSWLIQAGYFDIVAYSGTGSTKAENHSLGVAPSLMIVQRLDSAPADGAIVYHASNTGAPETDALILSNTLSTFDDNSYWNDTTPTSSQFTVGTGPDVNASGGSYVALLFAEKSGFSKFGTYNGTSTISTGLSEVNAVLVKRTDSVGDWYLFYNDGGTWKHINPNTTDAVATGKISVTNGDVTLSGTASSGSGIYAAWR